MLDVAVEGELAEGAGHGRVRERGAVAVEVGADVVVGGQEGHGGQVLLDRKRIELLSALSRHPYTRIKEYHENYNAELVVMYLCI